jgi:hypothetical protein
LVERNLAKVEVAGSNPVSRSKYRKPAFMAGFFMAQRMPFLARILTPKRGDY